MPFDGVVRVFNKNRQLLAVFDGEAEALNEEQQRNVMVAPTVHLETNGESTLSFQMMAKSEKWQTIKDPENIFVLNDREYTALSDGAVEYGGDGNAQIVNVKLVENWYLLDKKFVQAYNCGIYCYAKATFQGYTTDGAIFTINSSGCSTPDDTISSSLAWTQVKNWDIKDEDGNELTYAIIKSDEYKPKNWEDAPAGVFFSDFRVSGNTATVTIKARAKTSIRSTMEYNGNSYSLEQKPSPASLTKVYVNTTVKTESENSIRYVTSTKETSAYNYSDGQLTLTYSPTEGETINSVIIEYEYSDIGTISPGATCTFAYGAEVVDEHTFCILPKAKTKYKLTINGVEYNDSQVVDGRGVVMPRGSAGYAMWAALKDTGWRLGVCDVLATGFDTSIDYGCFNLECDMQNVLYICQYIQQLYGGILDWDSKNKVLNYRCENSIDYQAYEDGYNKWTGYEFRIGKNMTNQPKLTWDNEIITKGYVLGYNNLNIKKVNNGKTYVENYSYTTDVYEGYLEQPLIYDTRDDGGMNQLKYWANKEIAKKCKPRVKITAEVTDIRTVEGHEHEVFSLNNIARVYYNDSETGQEKYEEKRITLWEYNAFALWDCTVELGDKTQNLVEIFKLIYNTSVENAPQKNATGQIASDEIVLEVPKFDSDIDIDLGGGSWGGSWGGGYGGIGGYGSSSLSDYLDLIVRKTTEHTDAISGLLMEANELYTRTELFSQFQKVSENMVSETYAGIKTYADGEMSALSATVEGHYKEFQGFETTTRAGFEAQQTQNGAFSRQFAQLDTTITNLDGTVKGQISALAEFKAEVTRDYATTSQVSRYVTELEGKITEAESGFKSYADGKFATTEQFSRYQTTVDNKITTSEASIKTWANGRFAGIDLESKIGDIGSCVLVYNTYVSLRSKNSSYAVITIQGSGSIFLSASSISIGTTSQSVDIKGRPVSWKTTTVLKSASLVDGKLNTSLASLTYLGQ